MAGLQGLPGPPGASGLGRVSFFYLRAGSSSSVSPGDAVPFDQEGPSTLPITRLATTEFSLPFAGIYHVMYHVHVDGPAQFALELANDLIPYTTSGCEGEGANTIVGSFLILNLAAGSRLMLRNVLSNGRTTTIAHSVGGLELTASTLSIILVGNN